MRGVYNVIFLAALCTGWSALPNHRRKRAARWARGGESRRERVGGNFSPCKVPVSAWLRATFAAAARRGERGSALRW